MAGAVPLLPLPGAADRSTTPEGEPFPHVRRDLDWRRPDGWVALRAGGCASADLVVLAVLSPVQVPAYLGILYGLRRTDPRSSPSATTSCRTSASRTTRR